MLPSSDPVKRRLHAPPTLVGRENERVQLRAHLDEALAGRGRMVLVSGEAGIGKTTLVSSLGHDALERGALVLSGSCYDLTNTPAYGPWIELIRAYPDDPGLPPLPDQLRAGTGMASVESQSELFDLIGRFLSDVSRARPLVLLLEDLHWTDPGSLDLLRSVARPLGGQPVLLLVTYRDDEPAAEHSFFRVLPALVRESPSHRLTLHRLDREVILELIRERHPLSREDEERLAAYLVGLAEGNPFFTLELLYMLVEQRRLTAVDGAWQLGDLTATGVPPLIQQIISARLSTLDDAARELLELAAVFGVDAPLDLLQRLFDGTSADLDNALQQGLDRHLLILPPGEQVVRMSHALIRQAIYEAISPLRRRHLHRDIGELLAQSNQPDPDAISTHLFHAGDERGIDWLIRAAERAQSLFAAETVIARCNQARDLALRTGCELPLAVYRLQGLALETIGDFGGAHEAHKLALAAARERADARAAWRACFDLGNLWASRDYEQSRTYLEQALDLAREIGAPVLLGLSLNRLGNWHMNAEQPDEGIRYHGEALDIFERVGDQAGTATTLDLLGMARVLAGDADRGAVYYKRAIPLLRALDDRPTLVTALVVSSTMAPSVIPVLPSGLMRQHSQDAGRNLYSPTDEAIGIARDIGWRAGEAFALALTSHTAQVLGDYKRALTLGRQALEIATEIEHRQWLVTALIAFGETHTHLLALDRAVALLKRAYTEARESNSRFLVRYAVALLALAHVERNELDRAEELIRHHLDLTQLRESMRQRDYCYILARLEVARKNPANALGLLDQLEDALPGQYGSTSPHLRKLRAETLILDGRYPEAEQILYDALETARRFGFRPVIWRILVSLRTLYMKQGLLDRAEEARQAAMQSIEDLAAGIGDDELRECFLANARARLPERMPFTPDRSSGLTVREREVLALVAQGLTDAEAAAQLFISPRTVSQHLRSIYTKLDVANRAAAVRTAMERDLLLPPAD